jgi:hypothetical protein
VRAVARASFRGAWNATVRSTFSLSASRTRLEAFSVWEHTARQVGFAPEDPEMVLGITDTRLLAWRTSFVRARPVELSASLPVERLYDVVVHRHGILTGVSFVTDTGGIIEVEAIRGRALRRLSAEVRTVITERPTA